MVMVVVVDVAGSDTGVTVWEMGDAVMTKRVKGARTIYRKFRGVSDKTIIAAMSNHQQVLQQLIGAYTEQDNRLKAVEEFVKMLIEANPPPDAARDGIVLTDAGADIVLTDNTPSDVMLGLDDVYGLVRIIERITRNFQQHTDRIDALTKRVEGLEVDNAALCAHAEKMTGVETVVIGLGLQVDDLSRRQWVIAEAIPALKPVETFPFRFGDRVGYHPASHTRWHGIVIPRPFGCPQYSVASRGELTYVLRDCDRVVRGCFAHRLVRV
jgi:hypothetical protein